MKIRSVFVLVCMGLALAIPAQSQNPAPRPATPLPGALAIGRDVMMAGQASTFDFLAVEPASLGEAVVGAPYSADAVTSTVRTLADGTRIQNSTSRKVFRDSEGRTRIEQSFGMMGPLVAGSEEPRRLISISDPVTKKSVILDPETQTARTIVMPPMPPLPPPPPPPASAMESAWPAPPEPPAPPAAPGAPADASAGAEGRSGGWHGVKTHTEGDEVSAEIVVERREIRRAPATVSAFRVPGVSLAGAGGLGVTMIDARYLGGSENIQVESLGEQQVEGVLANGTRRTITIPTESIGNDRPIVSVTEEWYSPELQMLVMRTTKDPQVGEITYKVTNLNRNEPLKELFEIPPGYQVIETAPARRLELNRRP